MCISKYLVCILICYSWHYGPLAQTSSPPKNITTIFDDLPIDDAETRSILLQTDNPQEKIRQNIFIKASINKKKCFVGEPLLLRYELYTRLQSSTEITKRPTFPDFISQEIDVNNEAPTYKKNKGKEFRIYTLMQYQLFPFQHGTLKIDPVSTVNTVSYDDKYKIKSYEGIVSSVSLNVFVADLPSVDNSMPFSGAVGRFGVATYLQTSKCVVGSKNLLYVEIEGEGNFMNISLPLISWPDAFEHFTERENLQVDYNSFPAKGKKLFKIPFISGKAGNFSIPPVTFAYFNAEKRKYEVAKSTLLRLEVYPAAEAPDESNEPERKQIFQTPTTYFLFALFTFFLIAIIVHLKRFRKEKNNAVKEMQDNLDGESKKSKLLKALSDLNQIPTGSDYIIAIKSILVDHLNSKSDSQTMSEEALISGIRQKDLNFANEIQQFVNQCNELLYTPGVIEDQTKRSLTKSCSLLIEKAGERLS